LPGTNALAYCKNFDIFGHFLQKLGKSLFIFLIKSTTGGKNGDDGRQQVRLHRPHHLRRLHPVPLRLVLNLTKLFTVVSYGFL
jgi:hypothetical protein